MAFEFFKNKKEKRRNFNSGINRSRIIFKKKHAGAANYKPMSFGRVLYWFSLLSFISIAAYILFFSSMLVVSSVNVAGANELDPAQIKAAIVSEISGKYLNLISKNNIMLISEKKMKQALMDKFKRIENVQIKKIFPDEITVAITERKSMLILCSNGSCSIIDNNGQAYVGADFDSDYLKENKLIILTDESQKPIQLGDTVVANDLTDFIMDIKNHLKNDLDMDVKQDFSTPNLISGDIRVKTEDGWKIYFSKDLGIDKEMEMLKTVLNGNVGKDKLKDLDYVDLRTDNKVFYKFR